MCGDESDRVYTSFTGQMLINLVNLDIISIWLLIFRRNIWKGHGSNYWKWTEQASDCWASPLLPYGWTDFQIKRHKDCHKVKTWVYCYCLLFIYRTFPTGDEHAWLQMRHTSIILVCREWMNVQWIVKCGIVWFHVGNAGSKCLGLFMSLCHQFSSVQVLSQLFTSSSQVFFFATSSPSRRLEFPCLTTIKRASVNMLSICFYKLSD